MILSGPFLHVCSLLAEIVKSVYGVTELTRFRIDGYVIWTRVFSNYGHALTLELIRHIG